MQHREDESSDEDEDDEVVRLQFHFLFPAFGGGGAAGGAPEDSGGRIIHVLRFPDQHPALFQAPIGGGLASSAANNQNFANNQRRRHRPLRETRARVERRQVQHDQMIQGIQANMNMFAELAIRAIMENMGDIPHTQGQPPASDDSISKLPILHELTEKRRLKHRICSICQDDFKSTAASHSAHQNPRDTLSDHHMDDATPTETGQDDAIIRMPCHHIFHRDCLTPWLKEQSGTCPTCRYEIMTDNEDYNRGIRERMKERDEKLELELDTDIEDETCLSAITPTYTTSPLNLPSSSKDVHPVNTLLPDIVATDGAVKIGRKRRRVGEMQPAISAVPVPEDQAHPVLRRSKRHRRAPQ